MKEFLKKWAGVFVVIAIFIASIVYKVTKEVSEWKTRNAIIEMNNKK